MSNEDIDIMHRILAEFFPLVSMYESACSLFVEGVNAGIVTRDEYNAAAKYYGTMWNYCGD